MRISILVLSSALLFFGLMLGAGSAGDEKKIIKPVHHWNGIVVDKEKKDAGPKTGYVTDFKEFNKLWNTWGLDERKLPKLDFKKHIVFVQVATGPNAVSTTYTLEKNGNLTASPLQTLKAGPGFGYGIDVLEREGIKTYMGKPIE